MNEPITERTPQGIAAEINRIKQHSYKIMLTNAIKVGKRLKEAKALLSQRTANRLIQLFEQYGDKLFASNDDDGSSNSSALTNLTHYQALLLLGIPEDEREKFILRHDVEDMTARELDQALKERNQTAPKKEQAQVARSRRW